MRPRVSHRGLSLSGMLSYVYAAARVAQGALFVGNVVLRVCGRACRTRGSLCRECCPTCMRPRVSHRGLSLPGILSCCAVPAITCIGWLVLDGIHYLVLNIPRKSLPVFGQHRNEQWTRPRIDNHQDIHYIVVNTSIRSADRKCVKQNGYIG